MVSELKRAHRLNESPNFISLTALESKGSFKIRLYIEAIAQKKIVWWEFYLHF